MAKNFASMEHRGEILRDVLAELGISQRQLARNLKVHHNTVANYLERPDLSDELVTKISRELRYELADRIPSLQKPSAIDSHVAEPQSLHIPSPAAVVPDSLPACQKELMRLQAAHISLLTEHLNLVRKYQQVQAA